MPGGGFFWSSLYSYHMLAEKNEVGQGKIRTFVIRLDVAILLCVSMNA